MCVGCYGFLRFVFAFPLRRLRELLSASIGVTAYGSVIMCSCVCFMYTSIKSAGMSVAGCIGNRAKSQCCPSCFFQESPSSIPECRTKCAVKLSVLCVQPPLACLSGHKIIPLFRVFILHPFFRIMLYCRMALGHFAYRSAIYDEKSGLRRPT